LHRDVAVLARIARTAALILEAAVRPQARGFRWLRTESIASLQEREAVVSQASRELLPLGFVPLRPSASVTPERARELLHRHVVMFVTGDAERLVAVDWIRRLSRASPRSHLVVEMSSGRARAPLHRNREAWRTARLACGIMARGELARAEAMLTGAAMEARLRGAARSAGVRLALGQLYFWQGRFEEAQAELDVSPATSDAALAWRALGAWARGDPGALSWLIKRFVRHDAGSPLGPSLDRAVLAESLISQGRTRRALEILEGAASPFGPRIDDVLLSWLRCRCEDAPAPTSAPHVHRYIQRTGAMGIARWGLGRPTMSVLHAVPALLQLVQESDDDLVTLRRGCAWMRKHTGADAVGVVTADARALIAAEGLRESDLTDHDIVATVSPAGSKSVACVSHMIVASPVRYGGATIGAVVAKGRLEAAETLRDAAAALAALLGSVVRARLDAVALAGSHHGVAPEILGRSPAIAAVREAIARAARTSFAVLIEGESGTGKELVARALHRLSARRDRRLAAVNCAALTDELIEA